MSDDQTKSQNETCPKCGAPLAEIEETPTGRKLQRCSTGAWDPQTKKTTGCTYVKWLPVEPIPLEEKCPKCGEPLVMAVTRFGKKMKKCSTNQWDSEQKKATGCDYIEWINGTTEKLDEVCPQCGSQLVLFTTNKGKKLKKCSTAGWDREKKQATGCPYVQWLKRNEYPDNTSNEGEENLPPPPEE